jgi:hypothetical protein
MEAKKETLLMVDNIFNIEATLQTRMDISNEGISTEFLAINICSKKKNSHKESQNYQSTKWDLPLESMQKMK